jgi:hypothetical protein
MVKAPSASAAARKVVDESPAFDVTPESYVDMVNEASVDIDSPPLADYGDYNDGLEEGLEGDEFEEGEHTDGEDEDELEEIEEGAFDGAVAKAKGRAIRSDNYTDFEEGGFDGCHLGFVVWEYARCSYTALKICNFPI